MSLLDEYGHACVILKQVRTQSDEGGWETVWEDGEEFIGYKALESSPETVKADRTGSESTYSVLTAQDVPISYDDYFRDEATGQTYRVTSNPEASRTPPSASFSLKRFTAEKKEPPT